MKKYRRITYLVLTVLSIYILICTAFYFFQESLLFHPRVHDAGHMPAIRQSYEELTFTTEDEISLNGLLIRSDSTKGLVFYLHGNAGSIYERIDQAQLFTQAGFDFFMMDYRGFGKSQGKISGEKELHNDVEHVFTQVKKRYSNMPVIILGYSIGTAPAAKLAAYNDASLLALLAPYYSITDLTNKYYPFIPSFLIRYPLATYRYLPECDMPVILFHGAEDNLIPPESSVRLQNHLKSSDSLVIIRGQGHNGIPYTNVFKKTMTEILHAL